MPGPQGPVATGNSMLHQQAHTAQTYTAHQQTFQIHCNRGTKGAFTPISPHLYVGTQRVKMPGLQGPVATDSSIAAMPHTQGLSQAMTRRHIADT